MVSSKKCIIANETREERWVLEILVDGLNTSGIDVHSNEFAQRNNLTPLIDFWKGSFLGIDDA